MVTVYFETIGYSEKVATFESEEVYLTCLPSLKIEAERLGFEKVTESIS